MKDEAIALVAGVPNPAQKLNLLREYLQAFTLRSLSDSEAFSQLAFVGGTALRFLFGLPRFSEDLDFSLEKSDGYEPQRWLDRLKRELSLSGYEATLSWDERRVVHVVWVKLTGLLEEIGLATRPKQKLSIKLEIDTRPPGGARLRRTVINRHMIFALQHHDLESLMAGKVHALLVRPYTKGRDWYDLLWYRSQRPPVEPNLVLLGNALDQTDGQGGYDPASWRDGLRDRLMALDQGRLVDDVRNFLERPEDRRLLTLDNLASLLGG